MGKQAIKVTVFHFDSGTYEKHVYDGCFWDEDQSSAIKKSGLADADSLYVSIPYSSIKKLEISKGKDYIIQGETELEIDNTSQSTQSGSIHALKDSHDMFILNAVSFKNHGSKRMWHWELSGK